MENIILTSLSLDNLASRVAEKIIELQTDSALPHEPVFSDEFLSIAEASQFLHLAIATIYTLTCKNDIPFIKKGKKLYFLKADLIAWLKDGKQQTRHQIEMEAERYLVRRNKKNGL